MGAESCRKASRRARCGKVFEKASKRRNRLCYSAPMTRDKQKRVGVTRPQDVKVRKKSVPAGHAHRSGKDYDRTRLKQQDRRREQDDA